MVQKFSYNVGKIRKLLDIKSFDENKIKEELLKIFHVGDKISKAKIKKSLSNIYNSIGYKATAKATDLNKYFELRSTQVKDENKWVPGFELLKKQ